MLLSYCNYYFGSGYSYIHYMDSFGALVVAIAEFADLFKIIKISPLLLINSSVML